jgi:hypothetical protein
MQRKACASGTLLAMATLLGCNSSSSSGGGFSTSPPGGSALEALSPAQTTQLCDDLDAYLTKLVTSPSACQTIGAFAAGEYAAANPAAIDQTLQQFCAAAVAACAIPPADAGRADASASAHPDAAGTDAGRTDAGRTDTGPSDAGLPAGTRCGSTVGCTATVSQVSACANDSGPALATFEAMFPACGMVTRAKLATLQLDAGPMEPTSCTVLDNECPGWRPPLSLGLGGSH